MKESARSAFGRWSSVLAAVLLAGCDGTVAVETIRLGPGELGRVGGRVVTKEEVRAVTGEALGASDARATWSRLERDLLLAQAARERLPSSAVVVERAVLVRALFEQLAERAEAAGPASFEDFAREREAAWLEVDRPRAVRAAEIFVPVETMAPDEERAVLAETIRAAVADEHTLDRFVEAARRALAAHPDVTLRGLPPVAADGRVVPVDAADRNADPVSPEVAAAVARLDAVGVVGPVVPLADGFRIFFVIEIRPELRLSDEEAQKLLVPRIMARRSAAEAERLEREGEKAGVFVTEGHAALTRLVWREP